MSKNYSITKSSTALNADSKSFVKLANIILFISKLEHKTLHLTRLLKLLYIIDEKSISIIGSPVTNLEYKVAEKGPLADHLWFCIQNSPELFEDFFEINFNGSTSSYSLKQKKDANLMVLSDFEEDLIKETVNNYKGVKTEEIINDLHKKDTLWYKTKKKYNLNFENSESYTISPYLIDFTDLVKNNEIKLDAYSNYLSRK